MRRLFLVLAFAANALGATYYIDFAGGSDKNDGASKNTAWQQHPYMHGFTGTYVHSIGDRFIFRGGVTWPNAVFPLAIRAGGNASVCDYYGVDPTWYSGSAWARPIFDAGGLRIGNSRNPFIVAISYTMIDRIEFTGFYWDAATGGWGTSMVYVYGQQYVTIDDCFFHNWTHASVVAGCADDLDVIFSGGIGSVVTNCTFDGAPSGGDSGRAVEGLSIIRNCTVRNCSNGFTPSGNYCEVSGCDIGPINRSFSGGHENGIEPVGSCALIKIFNNVLHDCTAVTILTGSPGDVSYIYNNVFYSSISTPIQLDGRGSPSSGQFAAYIHNNTIVTANGATAIRGDTGTWGTADIRNNHIIGGTIRVSFANTLTCDHNLLQTAEQAAAAGFVTSNLFSPTSSKAATVNTGVNLSVEFNTDRLGRTRPQVSAWDIGAYEYKGITPPRNLRLERP